MATVGSKGLVQYTVMSPALDLRRNRAVSAVGTLTQAVGVDGRFSGGVRRFPGMTRLATLQLASDNAGSQTVGAMSSPTYFKAVAIRKGTTTTFLRGFVIQGTMGGSARVNFVYYDAGWKYYFIESSSAQIDVTVNGRFLYYVRAGAAPRVIYHSGTAIVDKTMGPGAYVSPAAPTTAGADGGGAMSDGRYEVAYRFKDTTRNVVSGMSVSAFVDLVGETDTQYITVSKAADATAKATFDTVEIYRSISVDVEGVNYSGGVLYKAGQMALASDGSWSYLLGKTDLLNDTALTRQDYWDPVLDSVRAVPYAVRCATYQGLTVLNGNPNSGSTGEEIYWSPLHTHAPESFPAENTYRLAATDGDVTAFCEAGDCLYAATDGGMYRFQRAGTGMTLMQMHSYRTLVGRFAVCTVDDLVAMVTTTGLLLVRSDTGEITVVGSLDRLFLETWAGNMANVCLARDAACSALFVLNPDTQTMAVMWDTTNACTTLEDATFSRATTGTDPVNGGPQRAFFITSTGLVVYPNADRSTSGQTLTMLGVPSGTVQGVATSGSTTALGDTGAAFYTTGSGLAGCMLHMLTGANAGLSRAISSNTGLGLTVAAFPSAVAAGDVYAVSPVPFRVRYWPFQPQANVPEQVYPRSLFNRYKVTNFAVAVNGLGRAVTAGQDLWRVGVYRNGEATMANSTTVDITANPSDGYKSLTVAGVVLEPAIETVTANLDLELTGLLVVDTTVDSRSSTA